ncbi:type IV secretory system conjugative DNA transfer family protein [Aliivibrio fischeri]|uniref:type IV secretory system conjugative DNA transfer family protein n=2 Tax=Aliivibrio fischeri TaxID=668 RepID=UPI0007C48006|nr:type IV secretory system conjugative DNA transfer family protein [Aliivibrio fischeri]
MYIKSTKLRSIAVLLIFCAPSLNAMTKEDLSDLDSVNAQYSAEKDQLKEWYEQLERNAQRVGYNHAFSQTMNEHEQHLKSRSQEYDSLLTFNDVTSLVKTGVAAGMYLIGGIVDKVDASTETISENVILTHDKAFRIVKYPYLSASKPNWRDYLFFEQKIDLAPPPQSLLPRNEKEQQIWKENVDKGWLRGESAAYREILSRWQTLFADLNGMTRYWTAVETNQIKDVTLSVKTQPLEYAKYENEEELRLNPTVIQINSQATFNSNILDWNVTATEPNSNARSDVRDDVIQGNLNIEEITDAQVIIETSEFTDMRNNIDNKNVYK